MKELLDFLGTGSNIDALFLFFIPGFISLLVGGLIGPTQDEDFSKKIALAVGYSAINFAAFSIVARGLNILDLSGLETYVKGLFIFVLPFAYPFIIYRLRERQVFGFSTPFPSTWDQFFARRDRKYFVRAKIKGENRYVYGYYGINSMASLTPAEQMIFLESVYDLDASSDWVRRTDTVGLLLPMSECESLEFIIPGGA